MRKKHDVAVRWTAFPLHPETPDDGRTLEDLFAGRGLDVSQMVAQLKHTAAKLGLPFGDRTMTYNSRLAQELGKWAEAQGRGDAYHHAAFKAYFVDGRNIARPDVLGDIAVQAGLDSRQAKDELNERRYKEAVDHDWKRAWQMGINAVPTFHMNGRVLVGAQSDEALDQLVTGAG